MFFSKVILFAISLGAISVLASPHALHHHVLHRRAVAARLGARVASTSSNSSSAVSVKRQDSAKCSPRSASASNPAVTAILNTAQSSPTLTPTPTPTPTPSTPPSEVISTTSTASPSPTQPSSSSADGPFFGDGTFFATGLGACGMTNTDAELIVAISEIRFDAASTGSDSNSNPLCGQKVSITFGGKSSTATIVDRCTGCSKDSLDMTPTLFQVFDSLGVGRIHNIEWSFIN